MADFVRAKLYLRLSREDVIDPSKIEEKFEAHERRGLRVATKYGLTIAPEDIHRERHTGTRLAECVVLQDILRMAHACEFTHLVGVYQDRITRGSKQDEGVIEAAFLAGSITVLSEDDEPVHFDERYTPSKEFMFSMKRSLARFYAQDAVDKRKRADADRITQNRRSRGIPPYGYDLVHPPRDVHGKEVAPTEDDVEAGYAYAEEANGQRALRWHEMIPDPAEWPVLEEIVRRIRAGESRSSIVRHLNALRILSPGVKRQGRGGKWSLAGLSSLLRNTAHAGRLSQRSRNNRLGKTVRLKREEWVVAPDEGPWAHLLTYDEYLEVNAKAQAFDFGRCHHVRRPRSGELSGILFCPEGIAMRKSKSADYWCRCVETEQAARRHRGTHVNAAKFDAWAHQIVEAVIAVLPDDWHTKQQGTRDRAQLVVSLRKAQEEVQQTRRRAEQLMLNREDHIRDYGPELYKTAADKAKSAYDQAVSDVAALSDALAQPDLTAAIPLIRKLREVGTTALWAQEFGVRRQVIEAVIRRIDLHPIPEGRRYYRSATVTLQDWAQLVVKETGTTLPPLVVRQAPRNFPRS